MPLGSATSARSGPKASGRRLPLAAGETARTGPLRIPRAEGETDIRTLSAYSLALATVLSLAACGGGGNTGSQPALGLDDIRELTGLSAPAETAAAQEARQQDILARADSMILSTLHVEQAFPDETRTFPRLSECSGSECVVLDPVTGETVTSSVDRLVSASGDAEAEAIGSAHGITLRSKSAHDMGVGLTSFGAWMEHGSFALSGARGAGEGFDFDTVYTMVLGDLTDRPLTGSATWVGIMVGTPTVEEDRGDRLVGTAALNYDMTAGGLDAAFSGIRNTDRGTAHATETVRFSDLEVGSDGTFSRGQSGARIQGGFYGPGHVEAAGVFEQSGIVGAFGAKRQ